MRGNLIEVFKMFYGFGNVNILVSDYFVVDRERTTRKNSFKITSKSFSLEDAKDFFLNRIVNVWNSLSAQVVSTDTIETFKTKLDNNLMTNPNITYFAPRFFFSFLFFLVMFHFLIYCKIPCIVFHCCRLQVFLSLLFPAGASRRERWVGRSLPLDYPLSLTCRNFRRRLATQAAL